MNILKYSLITLLTLVLIGGAGYLFASSGIKSKPGYVKLTMPDSASSEAMVALTLGPGGVKPVRWLITRIANASNRELELPERVLVGVLPDLQGVQLRVYEVEDNRPVFDRAIDDSVATLRREEWQTLLKVREDNKRIIIMHSGNDDLVSGLSVLASTPEKAVFINLMGQFNPESIAEIAASAH